MVERSVIIGDLHGNDKAFRSVVNYYGENMRYVPNGDVVDRGGGTKELITMFSDFDVEWVLGNHCLVLWAALTEEDPERRAAWHETWLGYNDDGDGGYEDRTLDSYGIKRRETHEDTAQALQEKMASLGHLALLESALWYYETDQVLAIHAGLNPGETWAKQRSYLDELATAAANHNFIDEPRQIFDLTFFLSKIIGRPKDLYKPLVTGHDHKRQPDPEMRRYPRNYSQLPERVLLGSHLQRGDSVFVYETWSGQVRGFDP